jgi:hypothetical protein
MTQLDAVLWRCSKCQKWSHAQDKPPKHQRWVKPSDPEFDWGRSESRFEHNVPPGHYVDCGPFDEWFAYRRETS